MNPIRRPFSDRHSAGAILARMLEKKYSNTNALVLGIPRGGVLTAFEIARRLNAELSVVITKKLPHPLQPELAIGAAAEDGSVYLMSLVNGITHADVRRILQTQEIEIQSRIRRFRNGRPLPPMAGRLVIIADDGIATGSTIVPAIKLCRNRKAAKVIVAAPVSSRQYVSDVDALADEVVIGQRPDPFYAVGQVYDDFHPVSDEEVKTLLKGYHREQSQLTRR